MPINERGIYYESSDLPESRESLLKRITDLETKLTGTKAELLRMQKLLRLESDA